MNMKITKIVLVLMAGAFFAPLLKAQDVIPLPYDRDPVRAIPRAEDHFWRKKVLSRIDLTEKVNKNLVYHQPNLYTRGADHYGNVDGIVMALINGFRDGKYVAYHPDTLSQEVTYEQFMAKLKKFTEGNQPQDQQQDQQTDEGGGEDDMFGGDDLFGGDDFGGGFDDFGDFGGDDLGGGETTTTTTEGAGAKPKKEKIDDETMIALETVLELIEDWIFDKNRSAMFFNTQYIRLVYVDPSGTIPDEAVIAFRYQDVMDLLDDTKYYNRNNDAEHRTVREIMEMRRFNSYIVDLSGMQPRTLAESAYRTDQILEYEHHLWTY